MGSSEPLMDRGQDSFPWMLYFSGELFFSKRVHRIQAGGAPRGDVSGE